MKSLIFGLLILVCSVSPCRAAGLQLSIQDGKVSIDAQDVTVRQILTEWARIGKTRIVNIERLSGGPITLKLDAMPEKQALEIVLRTIPGYIAAPREEVVASASMYDTILIMATTTPVAALRPPGPAVGGPQALPNNFTQLRQTPMLPAPIADPAVAEDQMDDPALAAAAAAGLVAVPAPMPGPAFGPTTPITPGGMMPGGMPPPGAPNLPEAPAAPAPTNPWNAPVGTPQPSLAPPPAPPAATPDVRPRLPQADQ